MGTVDANRSGTNKLHTSQKQGGGTLGTTLSEREREPRGLEAGEHFFLIRATANMPISRGSSADLHDSC